RGLGLGDGGRRRLEVVVEPHGQGRVGGAALAVVDFLQGAHIGAEFPVAVHHGGNADAATQLPGVGLAVPEIVGIPVEIGQAAHQVGGPHRATLEVVEHIGLGDIEVIAADVATEPALEGHIAVAMTEVDTPHQGVVSAIDGPFAVEEVAGGGAAEVQAIARRGGHGGGKQHGGGGGGDEVAHKDSLFL